MGDVTRGGEGGLRACPLLLNDPEEIQDIRRYHDFPKHRRQLTGRQELVDGPQQERTREKQALQQRPSPWAWNPGPTTTSDWVILSRS
jgi:hypothetical protein